MDGFPRPAAWASIDLWCPGLPQGDQKNVPVVLQGLWTLGLPAQDINHSMSTAKVPAGQAFNPSLDDPIRYGTPKQLPIIEVQQI